MFIVKKGHPSEIIVIKYGYWIRLKKSIIIKADMTQYANCTHVT